MDNGAYWIVLAWGLAVMVSWAGWGGMAARIARLNRGTRPDWGLRAAWGMAVTMALGSLLLSFQLATAPMLQVLVLVGLVLAGVDSYLHFRIARHRRAFLLAAKRRAPWVAPLWALAAIAILGSAMSPWLAWWDDLPAYLAYLEKLLATGSMIDPFAWRRMSTYGGQLLLQGEVGSVGSVLNAHLLDKGLALAVLLALLAGLFRGKGRRQNIALLVVGILAALTEAPRINTQSQLTAAVLFVALIRTLALYRPGERRVLHLTWILALLGAGLAAFRMNLLPAALMAITLAFAGKFWQGRRRGNKPFSKRLVMHGGLTLILIALLLVPWAIALYQSSNTPIYPLMRGTQRPEIRTIMSAGFSTAELLQFVGGFMVRWEMVLTMLPLICVAWRRRAGDILPVYAAAIASAILITAGFTMARYSSLYRYSFAMLFACALVAVADALQRRRGSPRFACGIIVAIIFFAANIMAGLQQQAALLKDASNAITGNLQVSYPIDAEAYRTAQEQIPRGEAVFAMVSAPYLLDFQRNPIATMDYPGVASPDPGMPLHDGPDALAAYLKQRGFRYILAANFDTTGGIYSRSYSLMLRDHPEKFPDYDRPDAILCRLNLAAQELMDQLAARRGVYANPVLRVIKLE